MQERTRELPIRQDQQEARTRVHATIRVLLPAKKRKDALVILSSIIQQTKFEPGCISCRLYQDVQEERALMLDEIWDNEKDLQRHLRSDKFRTVLLVVEMATESPEIRFEAVTQSTGLETIEQARTQS